jgi:capsular polysaccharide biosynthesis protein
LKINDEACILHKNKGDEIVMSNIENLNLNTPSEELSLVQLYRLLMRYLWLIIILTIVGGTIAFTVSRFILPETFKASSIVYIRPRVTDGMISSGELATNQRLANTYTEIARSNSVIRQVKINDFNVTQIRSSITVTPVKDTEIMSFSAITTSAEVSARVVNQLVKAFISEVYEIIEIENLYVIDIAEPDFSAVGPNVLLNTLIGLVLGMMLALGIIFGITIFDQTISSREQLEALLQIPVIGEIRYVEKNSL